MLAPHSVLGKQFQHALNKFTKAASIQNLLDSILANFWPGEKVLSEKHQQLFLDFRLTATKTAS